MIIKKSCFKNCRNMPFFLRTRLSEAKENRVWLIPSRDNTPVGAHNSPTPNCKIAYFNISEFWNLNLLTYLRSFWLSHIYWFPFLSKKCHLINNFPLDFPFSFFYVTFDENVAIETNVFFVFQEKSKNTCSWTQSFKKSALFESRINK